MQSNMRFGAFVRQDLTRVSLGAIGIRAIGAAFGFLFNVVLARALGKSGTGAVLFYLNFATLVGLIATGGMDVVGLRELSRHTDRRSSAALFWEILFSALPSVLLFSLGGLVFLLLFGRTLADAGDTWTCFLCALILALTAFQKLLSDWLIAFRKIVASQLVFYLLNRAASLILIVALISLASHAVSAYAFIAIYAAGMSAAVLYGVGQISPGVSDFRELRTFLPQIPLVRQGISCGMQNAAFILLSLSPFLLLGAFSTPSEIGLYGISQRLVAVVILALTTISQVAMGDFSRAFGNRDFAALARDLTASVRLTFAAAIGLTLPLIAFSPFLVLIFGKAFAAAAPTLVLLSLVTCAQCLGMPFQAALFATKHEKLARNVTFACATAGIALNAILIPGWGAEGAALGTGAGLALQSIGHAACALRVLPVRFSLALFQIVLRSAPVGVP